MQTVHFDAGRFSVEAIEGGFADPVFQSQAVFTALMQAMARPGLRQTLADCLQPPAPLEAGIAAVALTLCDPDTPVCMYVAVKGGEAAIANAHRLLADRRRGDRSVPA
jgi:alpha-D-ribose 1-methylphosphonate 5-triphosphate synthase subunit PhnH